jgi:uncharacterized membrane protein
MEKSQIEQGKACAALSYILIGVIWYFADENMKKNNFAKYHAKQGIVLLIAWLIWAILVSVLLHLMFYLWFFGTLLYLVPWVFVIIGIINAINGAEKQLPVIGTFADKFKF